MGEFTTIMARDGHEFQAYLSPPPGKPQGAVVVIQEIFGVNSYIRGVTDDFAKEGYTAIAPALFDRIRRGIELGYSPAETQEGRGYVQQLKPDETLKDLGAAIAVVKHSGRTGTVGYCWGGAMSYVAACELPLACAVVYYGKASNYLDKKPRCQVLYQGGGHSGHFLRIRGRPWLQLRRAPQLQQPSCRARAPANCRVFGPQAGRKEVTPCI
jgi:carboxymethylenebutenolidase